MKNEWLINHEKMLRYGLDLETDDPTLKDKGKVKARGSAAVFGLGEIIVTGLYSVQRKEKKSFDGSGGAFVRNLYTNPEAVIIGANICYDIQWDLRELGFKPEDVKCHFIDVSIAESLIDEYQKYSLDELALKYLNEHKGKDKLEGIASANHCSGEFRQHLKKLWDLGYEEEIREYVLSDADQPCRIWEKQWEIIKEQNLIEACQMNMDMIMVVSAMKYYGVNFDFEQWKKNCAVTKTVYEELKTDYEGKYGEVNINSPKQLAVQFDKFEVPYKMKIGIKGWKVEGRKFKNATDLFQSEELYKQRKTLKNIFQGVAIEKKRLVLYVAKRYGERTAKQISDMGYEVSLNPCINKTLFTELKNNDNYPIVKDLVQYKQAKNLVDKFLGEQFGRFIVCHLDGKSYPAFIQNKDGSYTVTEEVENKNATFRIHGSFDIVGARQTGRLSGKVPNLQQVASKTILFAGTEKEIDLAKMCRECFIAEKGGFFLKQDYCLSMDSLFLTKKGYVRGDEMLKGVELLDLNGVPQLYTAYEEPREMMEFELDNGIILKQIPEHRHYATDRKEPYIKLAKDFKVGDQLAFVRAKSAIRTLWNIPSFPVTTFGITTYDFMYLCGLYLGDGYVKENCSSGELILHNGNKEMWDNIPSSIKTGFSRETGSIIHVGITSKMCRVLNDNFGRKNTKTIPDWVFTTSEGNRVSLLAGIMDTDARIDSKNCEITMCHEGIMRRIAELLVSLGIYARWHEHHVKAEDNNFGKEHTVYTLFIRYIPALVREELEQSMMVRDLSVWKQTNNNLAWKFDWTDFSSEELNQHKGQIERSLYNAKYFNRGVPLIQ